MPRFISQLNHNGIAYGQEVDIPDHELEAWRPEIEAQFLIPKDPSWMLPDPPPGFAPTEDDLLDTDSAE